jgi:hypothetical protein
VSHQTEELLVAHEHDWVLNQFLTTRDARTANAFSEWLWGGMQYQLLHHLFPDMPRYKYPALRPKVEVGVDGNFLPGVFVFFAADARFFGWLPSSLLLTRFSLQNNFSFGRRSHRLIFLCT